MCEYSGRACLWDGSVWELRCQWNTVPDEVTILCVRCVRYITEKCYFNWEPKVPEQHLNGPCMHVYAFIYVYDWLTWCVNLSHELKFILIWIAYVWMCAVKPIKYQIHLCSTNTNVVCVVVCVKHCGIFRKVFVCKTFFVENIYLGKFIKGEGTKGRVAFFFHLYDRL